MADTEGLHLNVRELMTFLQHELNQGNINGWTEVTDMEFNKLQVCVSPERWEDPSTHKVTNLPNTVRIFEVED